MRNVAWILTRNHNLGQVCKILLAEAKELDKAGLVTAANDLVLFSGKVESVRLRLGTIPLTILDENVKEE